MTTATLPLEHTRSKRTSWPWEVSPSRRRDRLRRLRAQITGGRYRVTVDAVAEALGRALTESRCSAPAPRHRPVARTRIERLIREHLHVVDDVVGRVAAGFPRHVERSELIDAGRLGLVEAARRYDPTLGVPFERYATIRIRGAIIDSTRSRDWASRSVRRHARELAEAEQVVTAQRGRMPSDDDLAAVLGVSAERIARFRAETASSMMLSLDFDGDETRAAGERIADDSEYVRPDETLEQREMLGTLREAVAELPGVHGIVVRRYYFGGELLADIAADLGVTEARISQINSEAVVALRRYFRSLYEGVPDVDEQSPGKRTRAAFVDGLIERSTWRSRLAAADGSSEVAIDLRDPSNLEIRLGIG